jgi:hypothetical protein
MSSGKEKKSHLCQVIPYRLAQGTWSATTVTVQFHRARCCERDRLSFPAQVSEHPSSLAVASQSLLTCNHDSEPERSAEWCTVVYHDMHPTQFEGFASCSTAITSVDRYSHAVISAKNSYVTGILSPSLLMLHNPRVKEQ